MSKPLVGNFWAFCVIFDVVDGISEPMEEDFVDDDVALQRDILDPGADTEIVGECARYTILWKREQADMFRLTADTDGIMASRRMTLLL